jgi:Raf kinase inhibitor-like YbhB/YbcL family protein
MPLMIRSSAFEEGGAIPVKYSCDGEDRSPPLEWDGVPAGTQSLALIIDDPDAPDPAAPQLTYVHWVLYNLEDGMLPSASRCAATAGRRAWSDRRRRLLSRLIMSPGPQVPAA